MIKPFIPCRKCKQKGSIPDGYYSETVVENGHPYKVVKECEHHKSWRAEADVYYSYIRNGFQEKDFNYSIKDYIGNKSINNINRFRNYIDQLNNIEVRSSILYWHGIPGTQKTTVAQWLGKEIIKAGYSCSYFYMKKLIDFLFKAPNDEEIMNWAKKYINDDIVIIDEAFSKNKISSLWGESKYNIGNLGEFIRNKISDGKGIVFISNESPKELLDLGFDQPIMDIIIRETYKRNSIFEFKDNYIDTVNEINIPKDLF